MKPVLWLKVRGTRLARSDDLTSFWGSGSFLPSLPKGVQQIISVYDLCHVVAPETMSTAHRIAHTMFFEHDARAANQVVAISDGTRARLMTEFNIESAAVVRPAVADIFLRKHAAIQIPGISDRPFLFSVGTSEPRKNLLGLIRSFRRLKNHGHLHNYRLVVAGKVGWNNRALFQEIAASPDIVQLGYVDDDLLVQLYHQCEVFVFPSTYEGYGLPLIEARAVGARIVASDTPETREAGGASAYYSDPNPAELSNAILVALSNDRPGPARQGELPVWRNEVQSLANIFKT